MGKGKLVLIIQPEVLHLCEEIDFNEQNQREPPCHFNFK